MINTRIAQRYILEKELGAGGMGTVYRGIDTQTQQTVAIKHLKPQMAQPDMLERFRREGEALRELNHPNIVKMLAALAEDGNHYLIMEFVAGGDLATLLEKGKLPLEKVLALAIDLADALTRAHKLNIVHRDLKPANVLIGDDGVLRLTDFGVAHVGSQQRVTDTDAIVGTIDYLPPEAFSGGTIDARADIWAFGVMLFEMLSHEKPFSKNTVMETVYAITTQPIPDLETLCPDAPIALIDLIYRMLERDPLARIASVRHVGAALEDVLHGRDTAVPSLRFETPLPETFSLPKHNLPAQTTPFVGRESELTEIARLVADPTVRLITIVAPGGMGKTRLSLVAGENELEHFAQGVFFVELAPLSDLTSMISAIAEATGYQFQPDGRDTQQQVLDFLSQKQMLLILDNYEHLIAAAGLTTDILKAAPQVKLIATSRQRLNQTGETVFNLEGMDFPAWETPADALEYAAVKLFMQSAKRVQPQFELTAVNMNSVARICKQVQGMPLGIVLAAAWLALLSPEEIAAEIAQSFDFLESETGDLPERQRSMRAVFEYSWHLMSDAEKDVFAKLSVFRGGFTREAAEAVAGANLRVLMALVNKSLLRRNAESGRYEIHELLRQYGEENLKQSGIASAQYAAHARYFAQFMQNAEIDIRGRNQFAALDWIDADYENIRAGWLYSVEQKDDAALLSMLTTLRLFHDMRGSYDECETVLRLARERYANSERDLPTWLQITVNHIWILMMGNFASQHALLTDVDRCLDLARHYENIQAQALCLYLKGFFNFHAANPIAREFFKESSELYRSIDYPEDISIWLALTAEDRHQKRELIYQTISRNRNRGNWNDVAWALHNLGQDYHITHEYAQAEIYFQESISLHQRRKHTRAVMLISMFFNLTLLHKGDFAKVEQQTRDLLNVARMLNDILAIKSYLALLSLITMVTGDYAQAKQLAEEVTQMPEVVGDGGALWYIYLTLSVCAYIQHNDKLLNHYLHLLLTPFFVIKNFIPTVDTLAVIALVRAYQGKMVQAVEMLALALNSGISPWIHKWDLFNQLQADLQLQLGADAYSAAIERGKTLDLETVVQDLLAEFAADDEM